MALGTARPSFDPARRGAPALTRYSNAGVAGATTHWPERAHQCAQPTFTFAPQLHMFCLLVVLTPLASPLISSFFIFF